MTEGEEATNDCCQWVGVECNKHARVVSIYLSEGDLVGKLSPSLLNLSYLTDLELSENYFYGFIPTFINGSMTRLKHLDLSYNSFHGAIPKFIGSMTRLKHLDLGDNNFTGTIPPVLGNLTNLEELSLRNLKRCTVENLDWLSQLLHIERLDMYGSRLTGSFSNDIHKFSSLKNLDLSNNQLNGTIGEKLGPIFPKWIQALKSLSSIDLANNNISDTIPNEFWNMWPSQLTYLNLSSNTITGFVTNLSSNFDNDYVDIDLSSNNFYGPMSNVSFSLTSLDLSRNKFHDEISFLCQIVDGYITLIDLSRNLFTGRIPNCLYHFKNLQILNLGHNILSGRLPASIQHLINLKSFEPARYIGNGGLCGLPLPKYCPEVPPVIDEIEDDGEDKDDIL
ncbi:hypothetical protein QVD17_01012 [Tagetes erecta]|uniref:Disease resistance R13L4/SHOC-2-like LRR domain-containing protein n=1 Tax=Tagetes erecta TaxID=13708 RepID=A0AAD8L9T8_TARER|nr:hypothetical protein QVD17_01012 [Tagetes erecta]